jgi:hypothetical protein
MHTNKLSQSSRMLVIPVGQPTLPLVMGGNYEEKDSIWLDQPEWSAFGNDILGFGYISFANATHALFEW